MATMYTWDPVTGTYVLSDTGTFVLNDAGAYVQAFSVSTDLPDYAPGSTATFTANAGVGDSVTFNVTDVAGTSVSGTDQPWTVTDGGFGDLDGVANGVITTSWAVGLDAAGEAFVLSATDLTTGGTAATSFTDSVFVPAVPTSANGTLFSEAPQGAAGTGIFPSFVQIQGDNQSGGTSYNNDGLSSTEEGFNTNYRPKVLDTENPLVHNHAIQVQDIPTETDPITGGTYFVFRLDLNEPNDGAAGQITLDSLKLYASNVANLSTLTGATLLYDMDSGGNTSVSLTDWSSGSGKGDYIVKIPVSTYASLHPTDYIYLYSAFSNASSGFEEWSVANPDNPPPPPPPLTSIAGVKYEDANANGALNLPDDQPKADFTIDLYEDNGNVAGMLDAGDTLLAQFVTDASGGYEFDSVAAGNYIIVEENKTDWFESPDANTTLVNSTDNTKSAYGYALTVTGLETSGITGKNFANYQEASLSGHKYGDADGNLLTTGDRVGLAGWTINLLDKDGNVIATTTTSDGQTDANHDGKVNSDDLGYYEFTGLKPGDYSTQEVLQTNWFQLAGSTSETLTSGENDTSGNDFVNYHFVEGVHGLTQGFWSTHKELYQNYALNQTWMNITQNGVAGDPAHPNTNTGALIFGDDYSAGGVFAHGGSGKKGAYTSDSNDNIIWALGKGAYGATNYTKILLGDANGDGVQDNGETVNSTKLISGNEAFTDLNTSSTGNSQTIMLNQLVAAQLNIDNGDHDPGSYMLSSNPGHDLVGEAVQWLSGLLLNEPNVPAKTSDAAWTTKFFDTGIGNPNTADPNDHIMVSGQDIKNVLEQFNMNHIVTSVDDKFVGWSTDGGVTILGIHANTPDEFWLVALEHSVITG